MLADSPGNTDSQPGPGVCWLDNSGPQPAIVINTLDGLKRPETLSHLRAYLHRVAEPGGCAGANLISQPRTEREPNNQTGTALKSDRSSRQYR
jgi:hypothetical protein